MNESFQNRAGRPCRYKRMHKECFVSQKRMCNVKKIKKI